MTVLNLKGQKVIHRDLGTGEIIEHNEQTLRIAFARGEKRFLYPGAFDGFLELENQELAAQVTTVLNEIAVEEERHRVEMAEQLERERLVPTVSSTRQTRAKKVRNNIVFKCNFCDGGSSEQSLGFAGVCSDEQIKQNIQVEKKVWCRDKDCACSRYLKGSLSREELDRIGLVCYESQMLAQWKSFSGTVQSGANRGKAVKFSNVQENCLCMLTTRDPGSADEASRYIFAIYLINDAFEGDDENVGYITAHPEYRLMMTPAEARSLLFWNYYANSSRPDSIAWNSGLHRYFKDDVGAQVLRAVVELKRGTPDEELAQRFFNHYCTLNSINVIALPEPNGALHRQPAEGTAD